jgi:hypothetical protein
VTHVIPRRDRIYPVPVKLRTHINRWGDWPEDCVDAIRRLVHGWYSTGGVFKCCDCGEFCEPHPYGVPFLGPLAPLRDPVKATLLCDDCLIRRARAKSRSAA